MQCVHNHSEKEIMFYGCETNPMNQEQERAERDNFWAKNEESRLKNYEALGYHKGKMAERKRMSEVLTVNLDMSQMLDGWDKYWIDAKNGRYIEGCAECGNSKRIKESIINK